MSLFPTSIAGHTLDHLDDVVAMLDHRGRMNITDNPAQLAPAEGLIEDRRDPDKAEVLAHAAAVLVKESDNPGVLQLCAHIGASKHEIFYRAVVERLCFGTPIPEVAGMSEPTLVEELATTLVSADFGNYPDLHDMAVDTLTRRGLFGSALFVLSSSDPNNAGTDLLIDVLKKGSITTRVSTVIGLLVYRMANDGSDRLLDVARTLATSPYALRALSAKRVQQGNATWWAEHGARFKAEANYVDATDLRGAIVPLLSNATEMLGSIAYELGLPSEPRHDRPWLPARRDSDALELQALFDEVADRVVPLLEHSHALVRHQALAVLGVAPSSATTSALAESVGSRDPDVRAQALGLLADQAPATATPLLRKAVSDPNPLVRLYAWCGLSSPGRRWPELEEQAFGEPDPLVAAWALRIVGDLGEFNATERLLDVVVDDDEPALRSEGAVAGLKALGPNVLPRVNDRLREVSPAATWRLCGILDAHGVLQREHVSPLIGDSVPADIRIEAAAWLAVRELATHDDGPGLVALTQISEDGSSLDRVHAATKRVAIGDNDALLLILPLWFGPEPVRRSVREALRGANPAADSALSIYAKHAARRPDLGASVMDLLRVRGIQGLTDAVRNAATAAASDDLTRAALVALFADETDGTDDAASMLTAELDRRFGIEQAKWAAGFLELEGPLPARFTDALLARSEAMLVTIGLDLVVRRSRGEGLTALTSSLASEIDRVTAQTPARADGGITEIGGTAQFLAQVEANGVVLRSLLSDQSSTLAAFDSLEQQIWTDPSSIVIATVIGHALRGGLVEMATHFDELVDGNIPQHLRMRAVHALATLAPWRLAGRDLAPDPDGLLDRIRAVTQ